MRILYITSDQKNIYINDYMSDLLLHGLRELLGNQVVDYPGSWYMYNDESEKRNLDHEKKLWGKGFTTSNLLENYNSIDRTDILKKIKNKFFDLVIFSSIRRSQLYLDEVIKYNNKFIFIDGEDDNIIENKLAQKSVYFKRELVHKSTNIEPINFAIPEKKIIKDITLDSKFLLAPLIPGRLKTYIYNNERDYYEMYKKSLFGLTYKKAGWDCLRHYEILMNGCIPIFLDLENCPQNTLRSLPKKKIIFLNKKYEKILSFYNPLKIYKKKFLSPKKIFLYIKSNFLKRDLKYYLNNSEINNYRQELLNYTKKYLTTKNLAESILSTITYKN